MTGPEHYANAESDLDNAARASDRGRQDDVTYWLGCAQVHATLALAAATALGHLTEGGPLGPDRYAWICAASEHPGQQRRIREAEAAEAAEFEEAQS